MKHILAFKFFSLLSSGSFSGMNCFSRNYKLHEASSTGIQEQARTAKQKVFCAGSVPFPIPLYMDKVSREKGTLTSEQQSWRRLPLASHSLGPHSSAGAAPPPHCTAVTHYFCFSNFSTSEHHQLCTRITEGWPGTGT